MKFQFRPKKKPLKQNKVGVTPKHQDNKKLNFNSIADKQLLSFYSKKMRKKQVISFYRRKFLRKKFKTLNTYKRVWLKKQKNLN